MNLKSQYVAEQKLLINGDIRKVTNQMVENAREANSFVLYQAFAQQSRWGRRGRDERCQRQRRRHAG